MNEVAHIFREFIDEYKRQNKLPIHVLKVVNAIINCRTEVLGGHRGKCDSCGHEINLYNSCGNRHCPKCQAIAREKWVKKMKENILPVSYFHIVLTLPHELNDIVLRNKKVMYEILFKASSETLLTLCKDKKHLGAEIGLIGILHTWGQNLLDHNHIHYIVPGGGISLDEKRWINTKKKDFFIHVKVISDLFKKKFMYYFLKASNKGKLKFIGKIEYLKEEIELKKLKRKLYEMNWNVYCKPPFAGPEQVLEYIGRYSHRVAISNTRIIKVENGMVTFKWRDYKDGSKNKLMTLSALEFIRRFLLHVLPERFIKIRHYGILSNRSKKVKVERCRKLLKCENMLFNAEKEQVDGHKCPNCSKGIIKKVHVILPYKLGPPRNVA